MLGAAGRRQAAVLACGDGAVLSHRAAGSAWDMLRSDAPVLDVTVGRGGRARRAGLRVHTSSGLQADEVTQLDGLPITTPARTLLDLAAGRIRNLETALDRAEQLRLIDFAELHALVARHPGRPRTRSLKAQFGAVSGPVDVELTLAGYRVLRFTWEEVTQRPSYVVASIRAALCTS